MSKTGIVNMFDPCITVEQDLKVKILYEIRNDIERFFSYSSTKDKANKLIDGVVLYPQYKDLLAEYVDENDRLVYQKHNSQNELKKIYENIYKKTENDIYIKLDNNEYKIIDEQFYKEIDDHAFIKADDNIYKNLRKDKKSLYFSHNKYNDMIINHIDIRKLIGNM